MEAKEFLRQYQDALTDIRNLEAEAEELESMAMSITSHAETVRVRYGKDKDGKDKFEERIMEKVQSSSSLDPMGDLVAKICDMKLELMKKRTYALEKLHLVERVISQVDKKDYRQLLHRKYIERNDWKQISSAMNYSLPHIYKLHGWALQEIREILKDDSKCE